MWFAGLGAAVALAGCLGAVAVAMTGGPKAPFTQWAAPQTPASTPGGHGAASRSPNASASAGAQDGASGFAGPTPSAGSAGTASPSASAGSSPSSIPTASAAAGKSPVPTNPAGKTPPGHTKSARPHSSQNAQ